ncbi:MAG: hypothetical protein COA78_10325 [Blastopirellula sp.]|nr:MAG: hypothetical protein COA78_10325 [Blastopirellula sp.]
MILVDFRRVLSVVTAFLAAVLVGHCFSANIFAQESQVIQDLIRRIDEQEQELQYLRERDLQRELWEGSISQQLQTENVQFTSDVSTVDPVSLSACDTECQPGCGGPTSCWSPCFNCECPQQPAPCLECNHVSTLSPYFNLRVFGSLTGEMLYAESRPVIPSGIVLLTPDLGQKTDTFEVHGKSSSLGLMFSGPEIGSFQTGGTFLSYLYGQTFQEDQYGMYIVRAYGELKNDHMRFAIGYQGDIINPRAPGTINFNQGNGVGNMDFFRGQFRFEKYLHFSPEHQMTLQFALSDPVATSFASFDKAPANLLETNGLPNFESRIGIELGPKPKQPGASRPVEFGVSGLIGQLRRTDTPTNHIHDVWAVGMDGHVALSQRMGLNAEFFMGQAIGNYNASIFLIDNGNFDPVRASGGWGEVYVHWTPCLHSNFGYSIDDPLDSTLTTGLPTRNEQVYGNLIWDITKSLEVGFEISHWETSYTTLKDSESMVYHTRVRLKF